MALLARATWQQGSSEGRHLTRMSANEHSSRREREREREREERNWVTSQHMGDGLGEHFNKRFNGRIGREHVVACVFCSGAS